MKKKLIISIYDDISNPYYAGGGAYAVQNIAEKLSSAYDITVLTGNYPGAKNKELNNVFYKRVGSSWLGPKIGQLLFPIWLYVYARKLSYDVWVESFNPPFSVSLLPLISKKPVIGFVQMLASEDMKRKYSLPFHIIEKWGMNLYSAVIVLTESSKQKILKMNPRATVSVVPLGIDVVQPSSKRSGKYILFLGRIEYDQKGLDLLIESYKKISAFTQIPLIIAGSGIVSDVQRLQATIKDFGLENRVEYVGRVSGKAKEKVLKNAACIVIPSRFETFGLVGLEALAYGKPLLGFDIDGLRWIPENCMLKVQPFDTQALAEQILRVLVDKPLQLRLNESGQEFAEQFLWEHVVKKYSMIIKKSLGRKYER